MPARVASIWKHHRSEGEVRVYIGRACRGYPQSPLANPHKVADHGRGNTLGLYREWLREALKDLEHPATREIIRLAHLVLKEDVVLLCWCSPAPCHGDIVKKAVEKLSSRLHPAVVGWEGPGIS